MKTCKLLSLLLFLTAAAFSQIPYATQQPKWYVPIYFKDATGKKDTAYFGYDPTAHQLGNGYDINFGEKWFHTPNNFSVATYGKGSPYDSIMKVNILDTGYFKNYGGLVITLVKVVCPVVVTFDLNKLRSDSLPFPKQGSLPRAQLEINYGNSGSIGASYPCNAGLETIVASDTLSDFCFCCTRDSLVLYNYSGNTNPQTELLFIDIKPWTGQRYGIGISEIKENEILLYPNPVTDNLTIENLDGGSYWTIRIYNTLGAVLQNKSTRNSKIIFNLSDFSQGIYFIKIQDETGSKTIFKKIIKL